MNIFLISLAAIVLYILFIPSVLSILFMPPSENQNISEVSYGGAVVNIHYGESMVVSVKRPRWYGVIYEDDGNSNLYLFNFINLPLKVEGKNTTYIHILFFGGIAFINVYFFKKKKIIKYEVLYE